MSVVSGPVKPTLALKDEVEIKLVFLSFNSMVLCLLSHVHSKDLLVD